MDKVVSVPLENDSEHETIQLLSTDVEKSYGNGHGSFPTRNFSTKANERHSLSSIPGPHQTLLQFGVTKGWLVMIGRYSRGDTELQSIPQQSIRYTELSFPLSAAACRPSGPLLLPASPGEHPPRGAQRAEMETAGSARYRAGVRTASPLWSRAAQLRTSSFHCDIIFDIQFETLNSFNAISRHNDSNKAVPLAFDLTTKGKVERGGKTAQLC